MGDGLENDSKIYNTYINSEYNIKKLAQNRSSL